MLCAFVKYWDSIVKSVTFRGWRSGLEFGVRVRI